MNANATLIRNGQVYDGTGSEAQRVDVRIANGQIQEIGPNLVSHGEDVIEADGLIVAPGLIDLHVHVFSGIGLVFDRSVRSGSANRRDDDARHRDRRSPYLCEHGSLHHPARTGGRLRVAEYFDDRSDSGASGFSAVYGRLE